MKQDQKGPCLQNSVLCKIVTHIPSQKHYLHLRVFSILWQFPHFWDKNDRTLLLKVIKYHTRAHDVCTRLAKVLWAITCQSRRFFAQIPFDVNVSTSCFACSSQSSLTHSLSGHKVKKVRPSVRLRMKSRPSACAKFKPRPTAWAAFVFLHGAARAWKACVDIAFNQIKCFSKRDAQQYRSWWGAGDDGMNIWASKMCATFLFM